MRQEFDRSKMLGIGIDEDVAIVVTGDRFEIIGKENGQVLIYDPKKWKQSTPDHKKWQTLEKGQKYDLKSRQVVHAPQVD